MQSAERPTIKDVAKAAGVSPTTVSHALNGKGVVNRKTIERVQQAAEQIGYRPSAMAQGLRQPRFGLLAFVIRPFYTLDPLQPSAVHYFLRMVGSASLTALEHGYSFILVPDPTKPEIPPSALAADAFIVAEPFENDPVLTLLEERRIPFVAVGADIARRDAFLTLHTRAEDHLLTMFSHFESQGAQRIAIVIGTDRNAWNFDTMAAYRAWCAKRRTEPLWTSAPESAGEETGGDILDFFFSASATDRPDAIYCLIGRHASLLATEAIHRGISVPNQLMVAAASGSLQNQISQPTVTALDLRPELIAQRAVEVAVRLAERKPIDAPPLAPEAILTQRESTRRS